jgi:hypothetical protein
LRCEWKGCVDFLQLDASKLAAFPVLDVEMHAYQLAHSSTMWVHHDVLSETETKTLRESSHAKDCSVSGVLGAVIMTAAAPVICYDDYVIVGLAGGADTRKLYTPSLTDTILSCHVTGVPTIGGAIQGHHPEIWELTTRYREHMKEVMAFKYPLAISV